MTNLSLTLPFLILYAADEPKEKKKKISQHLREQGLALRQEGKRGSFHSGVDFGIGIFPKVQMVTLETTCKTVDF